MSCIVVHDPYLSFHIFLLYYLAWELWGLLTFSPFISCFFCSHFLLPPFCLSCKEEPELHRKELFAPEYVQSFWSTCISFNLVIVQYGHWRGAVHTTGCWVSIPQKSSVIPPSGLDAGISVSESPDLECEHSGKMVFRQCQVKVQIYTFWALFRLKALTLSPLI